MYVTRWRHARFAENMLRHRYTSHHGPTFTPCTNIRTTVLHAIARKWAFA